MRIQAYLRILSTEATIRALHRDTGVADASIKETNARRDEGSDGVWWNWQTQHVPIDINNPDDGLRELLLAHKPIFP